MLSTIDWIISVIGIVLGSLFTLVAIVRFRNQTEKNNGNTKILLLAGIFLLFLTLSYTAANVYIFWSLSS